MIEIHFVIEKAPEGGYIARAVGADIFTEADDLPMLHQRLRDAVLCHFDAGARSLSDLGRIYCGGEIAVHIGAHPR